jgi:hypothetical protein
MDTCISSRNPTEDNQAPSGAESSFGIVTACRDMFMDAFSAISVVHQKVDAFLAICFVLCFEISPSLFSIDATPRGETNTNTTMVHDAFV